MELEIYPASPTDARELTKVFYGSFHSDLDTAMFPNTPDVTEWWEKYFTTSITRSIAGETHDVFLKVTEGSEDGGIVAFAKWKLPVPAADRRRNEEQIVWPPSSDKDLCDRFFNDLDMLGVHDSYQGKGLGSKLLKWGLTRADAEGLEVYLSASPAGKPLYEKNGFRVVDTFSPFPDYVQVAMLRSPNKQ
ncbi:hypothetical protein N7519_007865 [Penicillium mononematosum]|uniref:uncharacterized protein n=1 Tax=Penicillium mononematosum TaxID=268346 RepID=UPI002547E007|nr:uncharacterized protein N7519_007865 [Penicillium mononematosum]KAJ6186564.1 hypothetical protein N7519_007865 [Penicillium mononematosum]